MEYPTTLKKKYTDITYRLQIMGTGNHDEIERKMNDQPYFRNEDEEPKEKGHGCYDDENMCHGAILEQSNNIH